MRQRFALLSLIVVGACASAVLGQTPPTDNLPVISAELEVTDVAQGHLIGNSPNPETSNIVRVGNALYFVYRAKFRTDPLFGQVQDNYVYVRRHNLINGTFGPAVRAFSVAEQADGGYHGEPSIVRDALGNLHPMFPWSLQQFACYGTYGIPPRHRRMGDLYDENTWSPEACLPSRLINLWGTPDGRALFHDIMGVWDPVSGITHFVGQGARMTPFEGDVNHGFRRIYYRIGSDGAIDGPYLLVRGAGPQPPGAERRGAVYTKGDIVLGREESGRRSVHLVWCIRNPFEHPVGMGHEWNYNLYYAHSNDGGDTWQPADGSDVVPIADHLDWNDSRFLAWEGDIDQSSVRSFDVDNESCPVLVVMAHRPGTGVVTGVKYEGVTTEHVNTLATPAAEYDLVLRRWDGRQWIDSIIDNTLNFARARPKVRVDMEGGIWVFTGEIPFGGGGRPRYTHSADGGATWTPWTPFGSTSGRAQRLYAYADPIDPNYHYIAYSDFNTRRLKFMSLQLTANVLPVRMTPPGGTYIGGVTVRLQTTTPLVTIRYTLDGSLPTNQSPVYAGPITLTRNAMLRAQATRAGWTPSAIATQSYTVLPPIGG